MTATQRHRRGDCRQPFRARRPARRIARHRRGCGSAGCFGSSRARRPCSKAKGLKPSAETLAKVIELRKNVKDDARRRTPATISERWPRRSSCPRSIAPVYIDEVVARFSHSVTTERPFLERLTQFWTNHFAVSVDKVAVLGLAGAMEREAIRPRVTGTSSDLLLAVEKHPAMLLYLDNPASIGPNSQAARFVGKRGNGRKVGINENLAREILELHTLGVDGGYTQADVTTFAAGDFRMVDRRPGQWPQAREAGRRQRHARRIPVSRSLPRARRQEGAGQELWRRRRLRQGEAILRDLAMRRETARHISTKLARHFIADDPPKAAVDRITHAWLDSKAHLPTVYEALVESPEAWEQPLAKFKTPADYIYSSYRALGIPLREKRRALQPFEALGQRNLMPGSPAGWPDASADWDGSSALLKRIAWADVVAQRMGDARNARDLAPQLLGATLTDDTAKAIARAESGAQALTLLMASPEFMRR